jgi:hypothetical protein
MANTIITKNSATATAVPTAGQLVQGELAVNVTDKRLFTENSGGTVVEVGTNPSTIAVAGNATVGGTLGVTGLATLASSTLTANPTLSAGTANGVTYLNGSKVLTSGSALTFDGTNLGIGTSSPASKLDVVGSIQARTASDGGLVLTTSIGDARSASVSFYKSRGSYASPTDVVNGDSVSTIISLAYSGTQYRDRVSIESAVDGTFTSNQQPPLRLGFYTNVANGAATERMRITSAGDVGIGTSSPAAKLDVLGSYEIAKFATTDSASGYLSFYYNTSTLSGFVGNGSSILSGASNSDFIVRSQGALKFATNGNNLRATLDSSGNLGLGVTPSAWGSQYKAVQNVQASLASASSYGWYGLLFNAYSDNTDFIYQAGNRAGEYRFDVINGTHAWYNAPSGTAGDAISFTQAMTLHASGGLSLGNTTDPGAGTLTIGAATSRLVVQSTTGTNNALVKFMNTGGDAYIGLDNSGGGLGAAYGLNLYHEGSYPIVFSTANTERARIDSAGNVGIGTTSPSYKLDVNGASRAMTSVFSGGTTNTGASANWRYIGNVQITGSESVEFVVYGTADYTVGEPRAARTTILLRGDTKVSGLGAVGYYWGESQGGSSLAGVALKSTSTNFYDVWILPGQFASCQVYARAAVFTSANSDTGSATQPAGSTALTSFWTLQTAGAERARITSSGELLVGTASALVNPGQLMLKAASPNVGVVIEVPSTSSYGQVYFRNPNGLVGSIATNGSSTSYNTSSDYRLKEDWVAVADASTRVNALKPVNFAWKADGSRVDGFLAHELAEVVPEAVTGEKDAMDDEGNPVYQGIDQSKLVPLLTAALQEALAKIESLTARVSALEGV